MRSHAIRPGEGSVEVSGGLRLRYRTWEVAESRAAVIVVHGLAEHGGRYERLGLALAQIDVSAFALDLRGHGLSDGRRGHSPSFGAFLQDLDRFRREVLGLVDPSTPLFILGHSMGGLVALRYQEEYPGAFRGGIAVSPWLATAVQVPAWKGTLAGALSRALPALPIRANIPAELLSHDDAVVRAYRDDPLVHDRITPRLFVEVSAAMDVALERSNRIEGPLLFMLAGGDRVVDTDRSLAFARGLTTPDISIRVYPDSYHEVLNEQGVEAYRDLTAWIEARLH